MRKELFLFIFGPERFVNSRVGLQGWRPHYKMRRKTVLLSLLCNRWFLPGHLFVSGESRDLQAVWDMS